MVEVRTKYDNEDENWLPRYGYINVSITGAGYEPDGGDGDGGGSGGGGGGGTYDGPINQFKGKSGPDTRTGENCTRVGDVNRDGSFDIMDLVMLSNCVNNGDCRETLTMPCTGDINGDGGFNILDVLSLANCILENNCGGL